MQNVENGVNALALVHPASLRAQVRVDWSDPFPLEWQYRAGPAQETDPEGRAGAHWGARFLWRTRHWQRIGDRDTCNRE